ncbi:MAG TPA: hypothetical protein PK129_09960 [Cellvibrionaceae bacterium]|nr:hypothetical protein [Cellvibrionaceae bacterium]
MTLSSKELSLLLQAELDRGYDIVKIARLAFRLYQERAIDSCSDTDEKLLQLIAMEEGPEFEYSEKELRELFKDLAE